MNSGRRDSVPADEVRVARDAARRDASGHAFALWEQHFHAEAERVARHYLGRREDREEAVADARLRFVRGIGDLQEIDAVSSWFRRIMINSCHEVLRQREGRRRLARAASPADDSTEDAKPQTTEARFVAIDAMDSEPPSADPESLPDERHDAQTEAEIAGQLRDLVAELPLDDALLVATLLPKGEKLPLVEFPRSTAPGDVIEASTLGELAGTDRQRYERLKKRRARLVRRLRDRLKLRLASRGRTDSLGYLHDYLSGEQ